MSALSSILRIIAEALGLVNRRHDAANTPEMKARKVAQRAQDERDRIARSTAARDVEATREDLAE